MVYDVDIVRVPEQTLVTLRRRGPMSEIGARMAPAARAGRRGRALARRSR